MTYHSYNKESLKRSLLSVTRGLRRSKAFESVRKRLIALQNVSERFSDKSINSDSNGWVNFNINDDGVVNVIPNPNPNPNGSLNGHASAHVNVIAKVNVCVYRNVNRNGKLNVNDNV